MTDTGLTAEELATWLTPRQALRAIKDAFPDAAIAGRTIFGRLQGGLIKAGAKSLSWGEYGNPISTVVIPAMHWFHLANIPSNSGEWWDTGDIRVFLPRDAIHTQSRTCRYFGVRFEPSGVRAIAADAPKRLVLPPAPSPPVVAPPEPKEEQETKGPRVSDAHLKAWHAVYQQAYPGTDDTEANALQSARGMFPGKSVSRDRVRAFFAERKERPKAWEGRIIAADF